MHSCDDEPYLHIVFRSSDIRIFRVVSFIFVIPCCHLFSWPVSILHLRIRQCRLSCDNTQGFFHCQSAACRFYFLANWRVQLRYFRFYHTKLLCIINYQFEVRKRYPWRGLQQIVIFQQFMIRSRPLLYWLEGQNTAPMTNLSLVSSRNICILATNIEKLLSVSPLHKSLRPYKDKTTWLHFFFCA